MTVCQSVICWLRIELNDASIKSHNSKVKRKIKKPSLGLAVLKNKELLQRRFQQRSRKPLHLYSLERLSLFLPPCRRAWISFVLVVERPTEAWIFLRAVLKTTSLQGLTKMETSLYVGNVDYSATEDNLRRLFTQAGEVQSVRVIKERDTGRSKGFAFVEMSTQAEAEKAISLLNGFSFHDRPLTVNLARPREDRARNRGGGRQRRSW